MARQKSPSRPQSPQPDQTGSVVKVGQFELEVSRRVLCGPFDRVKLTPKQVGLLTLLMRHSGRPVSRKQIMWEVWNTTYLGDTRTLEVHVCLLRKAIEPRPQFPRYLNTVSIGILFQSLGQSAPDPATARRERAA